MSNQNDQPVTGRTDCSPLGKGDIVTVKPATELATGASFSEEHFQDSRRVHARRPAPRLASQLQPGVSEVGAALGDLPEVAACSGALRSEEIGKADTVIRAGHKFRMASGSVWEVTRTLPGGKLEMLCRAECRSADYYHRQVKTWERVS